MNNEEKVFFIYEIMTQRILNSDRLLAERSNLFLLANSMLFAGFVFLIDESGLLRIVIPSVGIAVGVISGFVAWGITREMNLWLVMCQDIELKQAPLHYLKMRELIPYSAWNYWAQGTSRYISRPPERGVPLGLPAMARWEKLTSFGLFAPWNYYRIYIPALYVLIWVASLLAVSVFSVS